MQKEWLHHFQSKTYLSAVYFYTKKVFLGSGTSLGFRMEFDIVAFLTFGFVKRPFYVEYYVTDTLPKVDYDFSGFRLILWDSSDRVDNSILAKNSGWKKISFLLKPGRPTIGRTDLYELYNSKTENLYYKKWNETARRNRNKWLAGVTSGVYEIKVVTMDDYLETYKNSKTKKYLIKFFTKQIREFYQIYGESMTFYVAFDKITSTPLAGLCTTFDLESDQTIHVSAFHTLDGLTTPAGVGLIDRWFTDSINSKISFINFGVLWSKNFTKSWQGYSNFKKHFRPTTISYTQTYFRFTWK